MTVAGAGTDPFRASPHGDPAVLAVVEGLATECRSRGAFQPAILDCGCGEGGHVLRLAERLPFCRFVGIDLSPVNIAHAEARRREAQLTDRVAFLAGDYTRLPAGMFDIIVAISVLHLIEAPDDRLFGKFAADLKPGGHLVASMPYEGGYNRALWAIRRCLRAVRSPPLDRAILFAARALYGNRWDGAALADRLPYMYSLPVRADGQRFRRMLATQYCLDLVRSEPAPHASLAQPKHRILVFRRAES
jgi:SAM-dependent methyltransferase